MVWPFGSESGSFKTMSTMLGRFFELLARPCVLLMLNLHHGCFRTGEDWTGGDVMTTFFAVLIGSMSLGNAGNSLTSFASARAAAHRLYKVIDRQSAIDPVGAQGAKIEPLKGAIELREVSFSYPTRKEVPVLKRMSLNVPAGAKIALVGASGCGKSTIVGLLQRFYDTNEGQILVDGQDIKSLDLGWFRSRIGLVSQEPILFHGTIAENIRYGRTGISDEMVRQAAEIANAHEFIKDLHDGYNSLVWSEGSTLSGGQRQRICIARAIVGDPRILLLDEATSALDNSSERLVQAALEKSAEGRTTIMIAHRLSTVMNADRIFLLNNGEIAEQGTYQELLDLGGAFYNLVEAQKSKKEVEEGEKKNDEEGEEKKTEEIVVVVAENDKEISVSGRHGLLFLSGLCLMGPFFVARNPRLMNR